jgi:uncharacterized protein (TIGR00369 family)
VSSFTPRDPDFEPRVRASFAAQRVMRTIGASLARLAPGEVDIDLRISDEFTQQNGFVHAGIVATIADSACGYAALSLMAPGKDVVSVEFKLNLLSPSVGDRLIARASVLRSGKTVSVCRADVSALRDGEERLVATMLGTMMSVSEDPPQA